MALIKAWTHPTQMTPKDVLGHRLIHQGLQGARQDSPQAVVHALGAVQAQDYGGAKWALALRLLDAADSAIEQAFSDGAILRTHILRPTWHFVTPQDIRWMLALTAPRVQAASAQYYRNQELDAATLRRGGEALARALEGGAHLTRADLTTVLERAKIDVRESRPALIIFHAELEGILCSGARRGKQHTYALLDHRASSTKAKSREESLAELTRRYFSSHGPATEDDFVWWSGLTHSDARQGLEFAGQHLERMVLKAGVFWAAEAPLPRPVRRTVTALLLPNYDEYLVAYSDRSLMFDETATDKLDSRGNPIFQNTVLVDGRIVGTWRRTLKTRTIAVAIDLHRRLTKAERSAVDEAVESYSRYVGQPATATFAVP